MPIYKCDLCFKEFNQKCNYNTHIQRQTPCSVKSEEVLLTINVDTKCCCCFKVFSSKNNRLKHERLGNCFLQKIIIEEQQEKRIKELEEKNKKIEEENKLLKIAML
jgi:hypothetical protein